MSLSKEHLRHSDFYRNINTFYTNNKPFFILVDFLLEKFLFFDLSKKSPELSFSFPKLDYNLPEQCSEHKKSQVLVSNFNDEAYEQAFRRVKEEILLGNSYLINLTASVQIESNCQLDEIFRQAVAPYKIYLKDHFTCFSPEPFIRIKDQEISTYPMKGTFLNTADVSSIKEVDEHATIVDLLRNDLSIIADRVRVENYRYSEQVDHLLQTSSKISGRIKNNYQENLAELLLEMLPAGSISGAPKAKTIEIIEQTENYSRGFYTGIAGLFDGQEFDSCVLIRFIERTEQGLVFKSGGGITSKSSLETEKQELLTKINVPLS